SPINSGGIELKDFDIGADGQIFCLASARHSGKFAAIHSYATDGTPNKEFGQDGQLIVQDPYADVRHKYLFLDAKKNTEIQKGVAATEIESGDLFERAEFSAISTVGKNNFVLVGDTDTYVGDDSQRYSAVCTLQKFADGTFKAVWKFTPLDIGQKYNRKIALLSRKFPESKDEKGKVIPAMTKTSLLTRHSTDEKVNSFSLWTMTSSEERYRAANFNRPAMTIPTGKDFAEQFDEVSFLDEGKEKTRYYVLTSSGIIQIIGW
ncbi:MAG: hypothetical protein WCG27_12705, partial [Pseudomonadota bacterium]